MLSVMNGLRPSGQSPRFATTRWSVVLAAGGTRESAARQALADLCQIYWVPLYSFLRRQGCSSADAEDLTQGFFARLLEKDGLRQADPQRGRFRSFLLASLKNFLANEHDRNRTVRRGGGRFVLAFDFAAAENRHGTEPADDRTPEDEFDRQWALALLDRVRDELRREWNQAGKAEAFANLECHLAGHRETSYREAARSLGTTEGAVKVAVHRLRRRFRDLLRAAVAQTVSTPDEVDDELRSLFEALRG
jgi:RNA polymerase sigma-70 factor (ECF subfamily)